MSVSLVGVAADTALDTTAQLNQGSYAGDDDRTRPSLLRALAPTLLVGGAYTASGLLGNDPFAKMNKGFMRQMRRAGSKDARAQVAKSYFESGRYANSFEHAIASGRAKDVAKLTRITSAARFTSTAEMAYMRKMAAVNIGKFASAANMAFFLAPALFGATYHGFKGLKKLGYELETPKMGGHFIVNSMQATERQRALQAMHNSEFNGRSAMGNEAFLMHQ